MSEFELVELREPCLGQFSTFILKSADKFVIAGYASVNLIDKDRQKVSPEALDKAFRKMMSRVSRRNYIYHHGNVQIGELLWEYKDADGHPWRAGVDFDGKLNAESLRAYGKSPKEGLFVICELFDDIKTGLEVIEAQKGGNLLAFSIGGRVLPGGVEQKYDSKRRVGWEEIVRLELYEVTGCEAGKNPEAEAFILKHNADVPCGGSCGRTLISTSILKAGLGGKEKLDEDILLKESLTALTAEVRKLLTKIDEQMVKAENVEKRNSEILGMAKVLDVADVEKESYREFMSRCMEGGKDMKACALEWKEKKAAKDEKDKDKDKKKREEEEALKAKEKKPYYYYYKKPEKPKKEDFEDDVKLKEAEKAFAEAEGEYTKMKAEIIKELGLPNEAEVIKKSLGTPEKKDETGDMASIRKAGEDSLSFKELLYKTGVNK